MHMQRVNFRKQKGTLKSSIRDISPKICEIWREIMKKQKLVILLLMASMTVVSCKNNDNTQEAVSIEGEADNTQEKSEEPNEEADNDKEEAETEETSDNSSDKEDTDNNSEDAAAEEKASDKTAEEKDAAAKEKKEINVIDTAGLDTENKGWGSGGEVNDKNIPVGCTMYQDKYGHLNADFVRTDTDEVFLTFDEGYEYPEANSDSGNTAKILDTLKEKGVTGVFFLTLPYAKDNPDLVNRMIDEGHILGNHSVNHPSAGLPSLATIEEQQKEVMGVHDYVLENYGYDMHLFRYPTGAFSEQSLAILNNLGYKSVFWSFAYKDWLTDDQPDKTEALKTMVEKLHPGAIYLLHGVSSTNAEVLGDFIDEIRAAGYTIGAYE